MQQHLALLKQEYSKLQNLYNETESKYSSLAANCGLSEEDTFASRLLSTVAGLHDSETFSDIKIKLPDRVVSAHKIVLTARSDLWNEAVLSGKENLDWSEVETEVAEAIIL